MRETFVYGTYTYEMRMYKMHFLCTGRANVLNLNGTCCLETNEAHENYILYLKVLSQYLLATLGAYN